MSHPESNEAFLKKPSMVTDVIQFLDEMLNANKMEDNNKKKQPKDEVDISEEVTDTNFLVIERMQLKKPKRKVKIDFTPNMDQLPFMQQIDVTPEERMEAHMTRERVAQNFRRLGNKDCRSMNYARAAQYYTKGLQYVPDTAVLYVNRALCNIKLRHFKLAIFDCEYVLNYLDPKCLKAWLYCAAAFKRDGNEKKFEACIHDARILHNKKLDYIETFLEKMRTDL